MIAWSYSTTSCDKKYSFYWYFLSIYNNCSFRFISKSTVRALNSNFISYIQSLNPWGKFSSCGKFRIHIWSINFEQNIHSFSLGAWWDRSIFSNNFFSFRMFGCFDILYDSKMLSNFKVKSFADKFKFINIAIMVKGNFFDYLSFC